MVPRRILACLVACALAVPMVVLVLLGVARLLAAMQDAAAAAVLDRLALAGGVVWIITLVTLLVVVAIHGLFGDTRQ